MRRAPRVKQRRHSKKKVLKYVLSLGLCVPLVSVYWLALQLLGHHNVGESALRGVDHRGELPLTSWMNPATGELKQDPQPLLNFVIAGHGKAGTTSLQQWLQAATLSTESTLEDNHPIHIAEGELLELAMGTKPMFLERLYREHASSPGKLLYGYKNPGEIRIPGSIRYLHEHFPKTVLIVGIRHPILWFESLYNFKVQNLREGMPSDHWGDPNELIGKCEDPLNYNCVGTHKGLFHVHLAMLGKTNHTMDLETKYPALLSGNIVPTSNPVLLVDVDQLQHEDSQEGSRLRSARNRTKTLESDLRNILALPATVVLGSPPRISPRKTLLDQSLQEDRDRHKIRICDSTFQPLRSALLVMAREISVWLRTSGFLDHPDVHVSSRDLLVDEILGRRWLRDPCEPQ